MLAAKGGGPDLIPWTHVVGRNSSHKSPLTPTVRWGPCKLAHIHTINNILKIKIITDAQLPLSDTIQYQFIMQQTLGDATH